MNRVYKAVLIAVLSPWLLAAASEESSDFKDYCLGARIGDCLAGKCVVFQGTVQSKSRTSSAVLIRITKWLHGDPPVPDTLEVPYADMVGSASNTALAWSKVQWSVGTTVTVVLALEKGWGFSAGDPLVVTTDDHEAMIAAEVTQKASDIAKSPELIEAEIASLSPSTSRGVAGYLFSYVVWSKAITRRGQSAELLSRLLGNPALPPEAWESIPFWLGMASASLGSEGRAMAVRRFAEVAQQQDEHASIAGVIGLRMIADSPGEPIEKLITPEAMSNIRRVYRLLRTKGKVQAIKALEGGRIDQ